MALKSWHGGPPESKATASWKAVEEIAATALDPIRQRGIPGATILELTARSSALVFLLDNLLRAWCANGTLNDALATRITDGEPQFQGAVAKRNTQRQRTLWEPLEVLDGTFIDEERFAQFETQALEHLQLNGIDPSRDLETLDSLRWTLTATAPADR